MRVRGQSILGVAATLVGTNTNDINIVAFVGSANPVTFPDRLGIMATMYDKYVYHNVRISYIPSVGTGAIGNVILAIDRDYDDPATNPALVSSLMSAESCALGPLYAKCATSMARDQSEKRTYFTNPNGVELRESEQFKFYCYANGISQVSTAVQLGLIQLEYDLELISPVLAPNEVYNPSGSVFLTSAGDFTFQASNNNSTNAAAPFGIADVSRNLFEVIIGDLHGTTTRANVFVSLNGSAFTLVSGMRLYLRRASTNTTDHYWSIYLSLENALTGTGIGALYNSAGSQPLQGGNITVFARGLGGVSNKAYF